MVNENIDIKNMTDEEFLSYVIQLKQAYINNDLDSAKKIVNIINLFQKMVAGERPISINTVFDIVYFSTANIDDLIPNETLFYIINNLENIEYKTDVIVKLQIDEIIRQYKTDISMLKQKLQLLINTLIEDNKFQILGLNLKATILKLTIQYQLEEEYMKIQQILISQ